jgi:hypothetical protein
MIGNHYSTTKKVQDCLLNSLIMLVGVTLPSSMVKVAEVVPILWILHQNSVSTHKHGIFKLVVLQNEIIHHSQVATAKT